MRKSREPPPPRKFKFLKLLKIGLGPLPTETRKLEYTPPPDFFNGSAHEIFQNRIINMVRLRENFAYTSDKYLRKKEG